MEVKYTDNIQMETKYLSRPFCKDCIYLLMCYKQKNIVAFNLDILC